MNQTTIKTIERAAVTALSIALGAIAANALTISPTYGAVIGVFANAALSWLNKATGEPVVKALSLPRTEPK